MGQTKKWNRVLILSLLFAACFSLLAFGIDGPAIHYFDSQMIAVVQGWEVPVLTLVMKGFTFLGSTEFIVGAAIAVLIYLFAVKKDMRACMFAVAALGGCALLNKILKHSFIRERPELHRLIEETGFSFPSGHSMNSLALYGMIVFLLFRYIHRPLWRGIILLVSAGTVLAIGTSRIYLGVHYPSDVLGGYLASGFWLLLTVWVILRDRGTRPALSGPHSSEGRTSPGTAN